MIVLLGFFSLSPFNFLLSMVCFLPFIFLSLWREQRTKKRNEEEKASCKISLHYLFQMLYMQVLINFFFFFFPFLFIFFLLAFLFAFSFPSPSPFLHPPTFFFYLLLFIPPQYSWKSMSILDKMHLLEIGVGKYVYCCTNAQMGPIYFVPLKIAQKCLFVSSGYESFCMPK